MRLWDEGPREGTHVAPREGGHCAAVRERERGYRHARCMLAREEEVEAAPDFLSLDPTSAGARFHLGLDRTSAWQVGCCAIDASSQPPANRPRIPQRRSIKPTAADSGTVSSRVSVRMPDQTERKQELTWRRPPVQPDRSSSSLSDCQASRRRPSANSRTS